MTESQSTPHAAPIAAPPPARIDRAEFHRQRNDALRPIVPHVVPWTAVVVFVVIAMGLAWLVTLPMWLSGEGLGHPLFPLLAIAMMFTPTVATFVVVLFVRRPRSIPRLLGLAPLRPLGRTIGLSVLALLAFPVLAFLSMVLGQAMGLVRLDFEEFSGFAEVLAAQGLDLGPEALVPILIFQLAVIPVGAVASSFAAFGEELGWRGWLLPNLLPLGTWPALVISGAVWGLWHSPLILLGYNYGLADAGGVALMTAWCILLGIIFGWFRLRSASVWPAVFAHGSINAATSAIAISFIAAGEGQRAIFGSILGWSGWIVLGVVIVVLVVSGQLAKRAEPGLTLAESRVS